jgi:hypothetical protein
MLYTHSGADSVDSNPKLLTVKNIAFTAAEARIQMDCNQVITTSLVAGGIVAALGLLSSVALGAPQDDAGQKAARAKSTQTSATSTKTRQRTRSVRETDQTGLMQLPAPMTIGATIYYWYRPTTVVSGRPPRPRQVYIISAEPPPARQNWHCCLMLGIGY